MRAVIAVGSRAAAGEGAGGSQGTAVQREALLGSRLVLERSGRTCRACCTARKHRGCSPQASDSTYTERKQAI